MTLPCIPIWGRLWEYAPRRSCPVAYDYTGNPACAKSRILLRNRTVYTGRRDPAADRAADGARPDLAAGAIDGIVAQVLLISAAVPSAVNSALIAVEYEQPPGFTATQVGCCVNSLAPARSPCTEGDLSWRRCCSRSEKRDASGSGLVFLQQITVFSQQNHISGGASAAGAFSRQTGILLRIRFSAAITHMVDSLDDEEITSATIRNWMIYT